MRAQQEAAAVVVVAALRRWHSSAAVEVEEEELSPLYRGLRHRSPEVEGAAESDSLAVALGEPLLMRTWTLAWPMPAARPPSWQVVQRRWPVA